MLFYFQYLIIFFPRGMYFFNKTKCQEICEKRSNLMFKVEFILEGLELGLLLAWKAYSQGFNEQLKISKLVKIPSQSCSNNFSKIWVDIFILGGGGGKT